MTVWRRIRGVLAGILLILVALLLLVSGGQAYGLVLSIYALMLELAGLRRLVFYFKMARFMVGGKSILYRGILLLDLGVFAGSMVNLPRIYVLLYICGTLAFSGIVDVLRALESRQFGSPWKLKVSKGALSIFAALHALIFLRSLDTVVYLFCVALMYSAAVRIISALRPSPVLTIS